MLGENISHYHILKKLGGGGMGIVYEAEDLILKRHVALKFLPDDFVATAEALERFKREAQSASALNHPNICTIYEIGAHEMRPFIAMELMEGQSLKHAIGTKGMDVDQIVELGTQIADALDAAHAKRIIHRDIKPANIFVTQRGQAKLLDFGLAKQTGIEAADEEMPTKSAQKHLTQTGMALGTVAYMSPEQARGKDLDQRTDLFSFGVLLYEMATGKLPFQGETMGEMLEAIFTQEPPSPARFNSKISPEMERIVAKAMEKDRNLRYQSAAEIRTDLQRLKRESSPSHSSVSRPSKNKYWIAAAMLVLFIAAFFYLNQQYKAPPAATSKTAIAVLPFKNMSADQEQEYFSDGLAEELIDALAKNPKLRVISRSSAFSFKGKEVDIKTIAKKLNVTHVLEGSVRKSGNQLRITAQVVEAVTDSTLWSQTYDRQMENIFAVQDDIAASVANALKVALEGNTPKGKETSPEALNAYLQGRYFRERRSKEDLEKAVQYYETAVRLDGNFARAWAWLAEVRTRQADNGYIPSKEGYEKARTEVQKALQLNPNLSEAYATIGWIHSTYDLDWTGADAAYKRGLELDPSNVDVIRGAGKLASSLGRFDEAISLDHRAIELDPLRTAAHNNLGLNAYYAGRMSEAEAAFRKVLELNPEYPSAHKLLGRIYLAQSKWEEALAEILKEPEPNWRGQGLALVYHALGKEKEADAALLEYEEKYHDNFAFQIAEIYAYRGEADKAFEWLERAYQQRDGGLSTFKGDPLLHNLEKDPRHRAFLRKLKLPED